MKIWKPEDAEPEIIEEDDYDKSWIFDDPQSEKIIQQLGFDKPTAAQLWQRWTEWAEEGGAEFDCASRDVPFLALVKGRVEYSKEIWGDDDEAWIGWMQKHGIATELQDAIMDPRFKQLRLTRTCEQWVLDTIDMRYKTFYDRGTESESGRIGNLSNTEKGASSDTGTVAHEETPEVTVLYKVIALDRHRNNCSRLLDSEGRLKHMSWLKTYSESEFSESKAMIHLDTSLQTAQLRASYHKRLSNNLGQKVVIVRICLPETVKQDQAVQVYFPSDDWKKLVWYCRTQEYDEKLREEASLVYRAAFKVGNVTSRPDGTFRELDSWEEITEEHVLKLHGHDEREIQYVFDGDSEGEGLLREHVTDVKIMPYSTEEHLKWMREHEDLSQRNIVRSHCCLQ